MTDCNELANEFNEYYRNIAQNTAGKATIKLPGSNNGKSTVEIIIKTYEHHPSIKLIKENIQKENNNFNPFTLTNNFNFNPLTFVFLAFSGD